MRLIPICFLILALLSSCVGPYALQRSLGEYKSPLGYTFDSRLDTIKGDCKIYLKIIDKLSLNDTTKVTEEGFLIMPLIIAGGYKYDFTVTLGKKNVQPSFPEFIQNTFQTEVKRSGDFNINKKSFRSDYIIEMTLLECQISTQYHKDRIRYGQNSKENWVLKPMTGLFKIEVRLLENKKVVFNKLYSSTKSSQHETQRFNSESEMNNKMMNDFANTASLEIKEIVESAIQDINEQIK
jgi:hypothetical protein